MHPDLYNFHTRSLATTSATLGSSTSSALSLTKPPASLGNHQSCHYSRSWNDGCPLATTGFFTPAKQALGTNHCPDHSALERMVPLHFFVKGGSPPSLGHLSYPIHLYIVLILFSLVLMITLQLLLFYLLSSRVCKVLVICCTLWPFVHYCKTGFSSYSHYSG